MKKNRVAPRINTNLCASPSPSKYPTQTKRTQKYYEEIVLPARPTSADIQMVTQKLLLENPAPYTSALNWVILDRKKERVLFGKQENASR